jgi:hypothetical protein
MSAEASVQDLEAELVAFLRDELRIDESELSRDVMLVRTGLLDSVGSCSSRPGWRASSISRFPTRTSRRRTSIRSR